MQNFEQNSTGVTQKITFQEVNIIENNFEKKQKYAYSLEPSLVEEMKSMLGEANATSQADFVRQAIKFYIAFLHQKKSIDFISPLLATTIKNEIESVEYNISEMLFKVAVELAILNNLNAADLNCDMETLSELRNGCANVVAQENGIVKFEEAYDWQNGN